MSVAPKTRRNSLTHTTAPSPTHVATQPQRARSNSLEPLTPPPAPPPSAPPPVSAPNAKSTYVKVPQQGHFRTGKALGSGGQAKVERLEPVSPGISPSNLVVKTNTGLPKQRNQVTVAEGQTLQAVTGHPNVVQGGQVVDVGNKKGLVMERMDGGTLKKARKDLKDMKAKQEITPEQYHGTKQYLVKGTVTGVDHVHQNGMLHNDVKPDNIMLPSSPNDPSKMQPKLIDFGLASKTTNPPKGAGTTAYGAPEMHSNNNIPVTEKSDVYGLGATTYNLTKGQKPVPATTPQLTPPSTVKNTGAILQVKTDRNDFIQKTMDQDPAARPTTQQALQHPYLQNQLISDQDAQGVLQKMVDRR